MPFFAIDVVASGLPVRNGDAHAGEIASMALQLLSSFNGVGYKHLPNSQVQLRIGMHSGIVILLKECKDNAETHYPVVLQVILCFTYKFHYSFSKCAFKNNSNTPRSSFYRYFFSIYCTVSNELAFSNFSRIGYF